jgi:Flp pilus assembly protein TadD
LAKRRIRRAIDLLTDVVALNPLNAPVMITIAKALQRLSDPTAVDWSLRAAEADPDSEPIAQEAGLHLLLAGRFAEAVGFGNTAVSRFPDSVSVWLHLAAAQLLTGDLDSAETSARQVVQIAPDDRTGPALVATVAAVRAGDAEAPGDMAAVESLVRQSARNLARSAAESV